MSKARLIFEKQLSFLRKFAANEGYSFEILLRYVIKDPSAKIPRIAEAFGNDPKAADKRLIECYRVEFYEWLANRELEAKNLEIEVIRKVAEALARKKVSENARKGGLARVANDPVQIALKEIVAEFEKASTQFKRYGYGAEFCRKMQDKYPIIKDPKTIQKLVTKLKKSTFASTS